MTLKNRSVEISAFLLLLLTLACSPYSFAADIRMAGLQKKLDTSKTLVISGEIENGDTESLINLIFSLPEGRMPISTLILGPSLGGNVEEAMSIGFLVRTLKWKVIVLDHCHSACSLIALSGVYRVFAGDVGLHRPYFDSAFYEETDPYYVEQWHRRINRQVRKFLEDSYVPDSIIEKMMSVSSREMWTIPPSEADKLFSNFHPYFEEFIFAKCGNSKIDMPNFDMNSHCLHSAMVDLQRQSLITFTKAVMEGNFNVPSEKQE